MTPDDLEQNLLTPAEVAVLFRVSPKTVTRWAQMGKIPSIRTLGGHRRFRLEDLREHLIATRPAVVGATPPTAGAAAGASEENDPSESLDEAWPSDYWPAS